MPTNHAASHADDGVICQIHLHKHMLELGCVSTKSFQKNFFISCQQRLQNADHVKTKCKTSQQVAFMLLKQETCDGRKNCCNGMGCET
jgi:hypothetical protein